MSRVVQYQKKHTRPYVLAKCDIEGSEYPVLTQLVNYRINCADVIQEMFLEWHARFSDAKTVAATLSAMQQPSRCSPFAPTALLEIDDESYEYDGMPLP